MSTQTQSRNKPATVQSSASSRRVARPVLNSLSHGREGRGGSPGRYVNSRTNVSHDDFHADHVKMRHSYGKQAGSVGQRQGRSRR
jgi:hypothetical protein